MADSALPPAAEPSPNPSVSDPIVSPTSQPTTQDVTKRNKRSMSWTRTLPQFGTFKPEEPDETYKLIDESKLDRILAASRPEVVQRIKADLATAERELMPLFRELDHNAAYNQNRYRKFQIFYIVLAGLATMFGAFQAYTIASNPGISPWFGFGETLVALLTVFVAAVSAPKPPLQNWITNRRRAEQLRREYFRFITNLPPYTNLAANTRRSMLARRAASINRGVNPDD